MGINECFSKGTGPIIFEPRKERILFLTGKLTFQIGFETDVALANRLDTPITLISGQPRNILCGKDIQPPNPVNVHLGYSILYTYANCIEWQLLGDVQAKLL